MDHNLDKSKSDWLAHEVKNSPGSTLIDFHSHLKVEDTFSPAPNRRLKTRALNNRRGEFEERLSNEATKKRLRRRALSSLIWNTSPLWLFLIKTKAISCRMKKIGQSLSFDNSVFVDACHGKGGLALF